jgi:hypothetical protein
VNDQRARDAVEHLQAAAIEVIESLRAFLDVAEDLVRDPSQVTGTLDEFVARGRAVVEAAASSAATATSAATSAATGSASATSPNSSADSGVTRIRVS